MRNRRDARETCRVRSVTAASFGSWVIVMMSVLVLLAGSAPAAADLVTDWNLTTLAAQVPTNTRTLAMVHLAMFDAVNAVAPEYEAYAVNGPASGDVSAEAAAAGAAYGVLTRLLPGQEAILNPALAASLAPIPDGPAKTAGLALGDAVAHAIVALRAGDAILVPGPAYVPRTEPGEYQLTPPNFPACRHGREGLGALRHDERVPVPSEWPSRAQHRPVCEGSRRGAPAGYGRPPAPHPGAGPHRQLAPRAGPVPVESDRPAGGGQRDIRPPDQRATVRAPQCGDDGRRPERLRGEVRLQVLEADHGHPRRRH